MRNAFCGPSRWPAALGPAPVGYPAPALAAEMAAVDRARMIRVAAGRPLPVEQYPDWTLDLTQRRYVRRCVRRTYRTGRGYVTAPRSPLALRLRRLGRGLSRHWSMGAQA